MGVSKRPVQQTSNNWILNNVYDDLFGSVSYTDLYYRLILSSGRGAARCVTVIVLAVRPRMCRFSHRLSFVVWFVCRVCVCEYMRKRTRVRSLALSLALIKNRLICGNVWTIATIKCGSGAGIWVCISALCLARSVAAGCHEMYTHVPIVTRNLFLFFGFIRFVS